MKKYDSYKDSGIEWIGEIPEHWEVKKLKHLSYIKTGYTPSKDDKENYDEAGVVWAKPDDLKEYLPIIDSKERISEIGLKKQNLIPKYSILVCCIGSVGKFGIAGCDLVTNQQINSIVFNESTNTQFGKYLIGASIIEHDRNSNGNVVKILNSENQKNIFFPLPPPLEEQNSIASFLDRKTSELDDIIADKKRLLELYEEEKTAIINQAVTKGLDPNAPMKDSGIEWLGEIPEHWEVKKLKNISSIVLGKMLLSQDKGGYSLKPYLRAANLNWINVNVEDVKEMWFSDMEILKYRLKRNDLLVSEGGEVGRTCIWKEELDECYIQNSVHKVTFHDSYEPHYYLQLFFVYGKIGAFDSLVNRISIAHLTAEKLREVEILDLPLKEQQSIVQHIESECSKIDFKKARTEELIELLTEYRTALISEAVTGKIKVTED
jgi:type I restriction enzyme S subunit